MRWGRREWQLRLVSQTRKIQKFHSKKSLSLTSVHSGHAEVEGCPGHKHRACLMLPEKVVCSCLSFYNSLSNNIFCPLFSTEQFVCSNIYFVTASNTISSSSKCWQPARRCDEQRSTASNKVHFWRWCKEMTIVQNHATQSCLMGMKFERWREDQGWAFGWPFNPAQQRIP